MRLGYFMMPLHPPGSDLAETLEHDLRQVERLDRLGFSEAYIGEHFTAEWENIPAPDLFIAAALQRTERIKLATGVSCMPNHSPFVLAHRIAQLDQMAQGRFMWGVGAGSFIGDMETVGIDRRSGYQRQLTGDAIDLAHLPDEVTARAPRPTRVRSQAKAATSLRSLAEVEREHVLAVLEACGGNKTQAAKVLGIDRRSLYRRLEEPAAD